jgi:hypothetical protein
MKAAADESSWDAILISKVRYGVFASGKLGRKGKITGSPMWDDRPLFL